MGRGLNQETLVPLGLAIVVIGAVATWVSEVKYEIREHKEIIEELKKSNDSSFKLVHEINSRLSKIEWALEKRK